MDWAIVEKGITVMQRSVVEVQLRKPYALVTGVLYNDIEESDCKYIPGDRGGFAVLDIMKLPAASYGVSGEGE